MQAKVPPAACFPHNPNAEPIRRRSHKHVSRGSPRPSFVKKKQKKLFSECQSRSTRVRCHPVVVGFNRFLGARSNSVSPLLYPEAWQHSALLTNVIWLWCICIPPSPSRKPDPPISPVLITVCFQGKKKENPNNHGYKETFSNILQDRFNTSTADGWRANQTNHAGRENRRMWRALQPRFHPFFPLFFVLTSFRSSSNRCFMVSQPVTDGHLPQNACRRFAGKHLQNHPIPCVLGDTSPQTDSAFSVPQVADMIALYSRRGP